MWVGRWPGPGTALERGGGRCRETPALPGALPNLSPGCLRQDLIRLQLNSRVCHQPGSGEGSQRFHDRQRRIRGEASACPSVCSDTASGALSWWEPGMAGRGTVHKRVHTGTGHTPTLAPQRLSPHHSFRTLQHTGLQEWIPLHRVLQGHGEGPGTTCDSCR